MTRVERLVVVSLFLAPTAAAAEIAAPETTEVFTGSESNRSETQHVLAHRFLLVGTESVSRRGQILESEIDYRLDPDAGTVRLAEPLADGEELRVSYSWVPLELPREFVGLVREEPTPPDSVTMQHHAEPNAVDRLARAVDEDLVIGGAKTVAIEVGSNKDATVEQSLRVSVTGNVGEDVRITALLSDQNVPLQPEGNTQRLEELDEVLIRVDAPRGSATLGDFVAERRNTGFGDFDRRLSGAQALARAGPGQAWGIGASTRGTFRTLEIRGQEGKQGPYLLAGAGVNPTGVIVAGSERVWVDGLLQTRGENYDYVIDYSRGELEFTNRRLITEDSKIAVDFEVAEQPYRRSFYLGEGGFASDGGGLEWRVGIASEVDDRDPLNLTLSDEDRALLAAAGDEPVLVPGDNCDSLGTGDYVERSDSTGVRYFEYVGADSGTCDVAFTLAPGDSGGSYVRDRDLDTGLTFFRWVGAGNGEYVPGVLLTAPQRLTLTDMSFRTSAGGFALHLDGAVSREDRNLLSSVSDGDNEGTAGLGRLSWERAGTLGERPLRFTTEATFRGEEAAFRSLGRTRGPYLGEIWNFADTTRADEAEGGVSARLQSGDRWSVGGSWGLLDRDALFRSERREGRAAWTGHRIPEASYRIEKVRRENEADSLGVVMGDLLRQSASVTGRVGWLRPGLSAWSEVRDETRADSTLSGQDQLDLGARLGLEPWSTWRTSLSTSVRTTDDVEAGTWRRRSVGRTWEVTSEATPSRALRARVSWIRRELDFEEGRGTDSNSQLTRADLVHESFDGLLTGEYVYRTTSRYFADILAAPGATELPTLAVDASARILLGGRARTRRGETPSAWRRKLELFRSESFVRVEEETTREDRLPIYLLDLSQFQSNEDTVFGKILLRQEITLFPSGGPFSLTARWERIDTKDNRAEPRKLDLLTERSVLRARNRLGPRWTLESQGTLQDDSRSEAAFGQTDFDVRLVEIREELVWQPVPTRRLSGIGGWVRERDRANDASIEGVSLGLSGSSTLLQRGRLRGDLSWVHPLAIEGTDAANRFRTRESDQFEWRAGLDLSLSDHINAAITYSGRALQGFPTTHLARAEARALF